jgi:hypothetical protein
MMGPLVRVTNTKSGWLVPISSLSTEKKSGILDMWLEIVCFVREKAEDVAE